MINLFLKKKSASFFIIKQSPHKILGAALLVISIILLVASTLIIIFAANQGRLLEKIVGNQNRNSQAFQAAEAGLEYGINYLQQNAATILASPISGHIQPFSNSNTTNVVLANNSKYTFVYTNPIANNYKLIQITSTGTSDDGSATRVVSQQVQFGSLLVNPTNIALSSKGSITMSGNATIVNTSSNNTINSASTVGLTGSATTVTSSGGSNSSSIGPDIQQNQSSLATVSQGDFFATYFGTTNTSNIQGKVAHYYNNSSDTNYGSTLNGMTGTSIWIDQTGGSTASLSGNTVIGSATNPVLLIVNGSFSMSGNVTIYGFIFVIGTSGITTISGNNNIIGGLATSDNLNMSGNSNLTFDPTVLDNLQNQTSMSYYAKVPGSWKDF